MDEGNATTDENQGSVKIVVILLHVLRVEFRRFPFVHGVEILPWIIIFDWLEVRP